MKTTLDQDKKRIDLLGDDGTPLGELEYMYGGNNEYYATHTEVFAGNEGKGYGKRLVDAMADFARQKNGVIVPVCPFVKSLFQRHPERYGDVMKR